MKIFDFIIIGSGLAGLNAALRGAEKGTVLLITKKKLEASNTWYAQGGIASVMSPNDNFKKHIQDTLKAGSYHNNQKAVQYIISQGPKAIARLEELGVTFTKTSHGFSLHLEGGHSENRIVHAADHTGQNIEEALIKKVRTVKNIHILENVFCKDLLVKNKRCYGVEVFRNRSLEIFYGKIVILATGGLGQIYRKTTNPEIATGDGIAMAFRAGAKLKDLEFIQFHPTALDEKKSPQFLLSEALRGEGAVLINSRKEPFMAQYHPRADLAPRDIVSRAIFKEQLQGKVFLDLRPIKDFSGKFPLIYKTLKKKTFKPTKNPIPVTPVAHYSCGGVLTELRGQTNIKDLYAFGEVACSGLHGANRLASNSLLEAIVMSEQVQKLKAPSFKNFPKFSISTYKERSSTIQLREKIRKMMDKNVGIVRNLTAIQQTINQLEALAKKIKPTDRASQETENIRLVALQVAKAAFKRKKSLGCHFQQ